MKHSCLIFSKNRAAQLHALLESFKIMCVDAYDTTITILYKATTTLHQSQYNKLKVMHPEIIFREETNFEQDVISIISGTEFILFFVDDCICIKPFRYIEISNELSKDTNVDTIGFSLRLGNNISYCYPYKREQQKPNFIKINENLLKYNWTIEAYDFGYPLEVSSSVYKISIIETAIKDKHFNDPNTFENVLYTSTSALKTVFPHLICYNTSRAFCNPLNVITSTAKNRALNDRHHSIETLSQKFENNLKISIVPFFNISIKGCHEEVPLSWLPR